MQQQQQGNTPKSPRGPTGIRAERAAAAAILLQKFMVMLWAAIVATVRWLGYHTSATILSAAIMAAMWQTWVPPASATVELVVPLLAALACGVVTWLGYVAVQLLSTRRLLAGAVRLIPATNGDLGRDLRRFVRGTLFAGRGSAPLPAEIAPQVGGQGTATTQRGQTLEPGPSDATSLPRDPAVAHLQEQLTPMLAAMDKQQEALAQQSESLATLLALAKKPTAEAPATPKEDTKPGKELAHSLELASEPRLGASPPRALFQSPAGSVLDTLLPPPPPKPAANPALLVGLVAGELTPGGRPQQRTDSRWEIGSELMARMMHHKSHVDRKLTKKSNYEEYQDWVAAVTDWVNMFANVLPEQLTPQRHSNCRSGVHGCVAVQGAGAA